MTSNTPPEDMSPDVGNPAEPPVVDQIAVLEAEKADLRDKALRLLAEMENLRRRTEKEVADTRAYAVTGFARDMLAVVDNLRRAIEALPAEARAGAGAAVNAMAEGVELTERDLLKTLERHGVKKIEPHGEKFDPNQQQAMFEAPHPEVPKGHVMQVVQSGFLIGERVLRPALVGVSAGAPPAPPPQDA